MRVTEQPQLLAAGPWTPEQIEVEWLEHEYVPSPEASQGADHAVQALRDRGSPAHDGMAARLAGYEAAPGRLSLELQPSRWALRLVDGHAADSLTVLCAVRRADGAWLAGRRAEWLASWAGRWALGAGGAVEVGESPAVALARELEEEWRLVPDEMSIRALLRLPNGLAMLVALASVPEDASPVPDDEHDEWAWWPADVSSWPDEADPRVRAAGAMLS